MADHGDKNGVSRPRLEDCCSYNDLGPAENFTSHDYVTLARAIAFRELRPDRDVPPMTERDWDVIVSALCIATGYELNKMTSDIRARQKERR